MMASDQITPEQVASFKRAAEQAAVTEIELVCRKHNVSLVAMPVLLPDGRLGAEIRLVYREG